MWQSGELTTLFLAASHLAMRALYPHSTAGATSANTCRTLKSFVRCATVHSAKSTATQTRRAHRRATLAATAAFQRPTSCK